MGQRVNYGIISDIHENLEIVHRAINKLIIEGADKLILNGDICPNGRSLQESADLAEAMLVTVANQRLETYVQPGSHESILVYEPTIERITAHYPNMINTIGRQKIEEADYHLVFLPGSDINITGGEYALGNEEMPTGRYVGSDAPQFRPINNWREVYNSLKEGKPVLHYHNMNDLTTLVTHHEKTVVICHVPRKFPDLEQGVDMAEFGLVEEDFAIWTVGRGEDEVYSRYFYKESEVELKSLLEKDGFKLIESRKIPKGSIYPIEPTQGILAVRQDLPIALKRENRGNVSLGEVYDKVGITKAVSGHFHESTHRACNRAGANVPEDTYVKELYWNAGHGDRGHFGLLTVNGEEVKYQNIIID